jgi:DNA-binding transcriptional regulator YhcF (GntR family)
MKINIERDSRLSIQVQLKEQIKFLILNGELLPGAQLPPARQLAGFLRVNRNTVHKAYQDLAQEGLIECWRGRGCVVVDRRTTMAPSVTAPILAIIDEALDQAGELGMDPGSFATMVYARAAQRQDVLVKRRMAIVECEQAITRALAQTIQDRLAVEVIPLALQDLQKHTAEVEETLGQVQVVATTFFHIQEVQRLLSRTNKKVVALGVKPHLKNLIQVAQIPAGTPAAMVCVSQLGALDLKQSLEGAGIKGLEAVLCGTDDPERLATTLPGLPVVIASDFVADKVRPLLQPGQQFIALDYTTLDDGAINLLQSLMTEDLQAA